MMNHSATGFKIRNTAGQAEILRSVQKDEAFCEKFNDEISDLILRVVGNRKWLRYHDKIKVMTLILYYSLTNLSNFQTLGEEYTGILQVDESFRNLPSKKNLGLMILLQLLGEPTLLNLCKSLQNELKSPNQFEFVKEIRVEARNKLISTVEAFQNLIPMIYHFNKALFYLYGSYYHISKRITGVNYALIRFWLKDRSSFYVFKILGFISMLHLIANFFYLSVNTWKQSNMKENGEILEVNENETSKISSSRAQCSLCFEIRTNTSSTPCGHLFCWGCIMAWLRSKQECPLCREVVLPSRVVFLTNF